MKQDFLPELRCQAFTKHRARCRRMKVFDAVVCKEVFGIGGYPLEIFAEKFKLCRQHAAHPTVLLMDGDRLDWHVVKEVTGNGGS